MATPTLDREFIEAVAAEMSNGIHAALECWMGKIERVLDSSALTTLGRLQAVREILADYRDMAGETRIECRRSATTH